MIVRNNSENRLQNRDAVRATLVCLIIAFACCIVSTPATAQAVQLAQQPAQAPHLLNDRPTDAYRLELIERSWRAATAYPINPHIKNRGRAEQEVVIGALGVDQPHLAYGYAKKMVNWRKGMAHAEIAHYLIEHQELEHVEYFLQQAIRHSRDSSQGWRQQRVKARVASARILLGLSDSVEIDPDDNEAEAEIVSAQIAVAPDSSYQEMVNILDAMVASEQYEKVLGALSGYTDLYTYHYEHQDRRADLLAKASAALKQMPGFVRFHTMMRFFDAAIEHGDLATAKVLLDQASAIHDEFSWTIDHEIKHLSLIARGRAEVGQTQAARELLESCVALADAELDDLQSFDRAAVLRPVAEAYAVMGDETLALAMYRRVVDLGAINPNIRPRVSDITATCVSMALHGVEPDANLWAKIDQIVTELEQR